MISPNNQNNKYKKSAGGKRSHEAEMRKALQEIIRLVEVWVDSDERKAEATMLKILNTALKAVLCECLKVGAAFERWGAIYPRPSGEIQKLGSLLMLK